MLTCVLDWLHFLQWGLTPDAVNDAKVGVSWMELLPSFMFFARSFVPVGRKGLRVTALLLGRVATSFLLHME